MKAITICQPWPWAIFYGPKRIENRTWPSDHRGPLLIHAGKSRKFWDDGCLFLDRYGWRPPAIEIQWGAIIGVVEMVDCVPVAAVSVDLFAEGPWCHVYENPRPFAEPIPYRGQQGMFFVPDSVVAAQLEATQQ